MGTTRGIHKYSDEDKGRKQRSLLTSSIHTQHSKSKSPLQRARDALIKNPNCPPSFLCHVPVSFTLFPRLGKGEAPPSRANNGPVQLSLPHPGKIITSSQRAPRKTTSQPPTPPRDSATRIPYPPLWSNSRPCSRSAAQPLQ